MLNKKIRLINKLSRVLLVLAVTFILGCVEEKNEYTINPDGSGKVAYSVTFAPTHFNLNEKEPDLQNQIIPEIEKILQQSKGIDVWKNISYKLTDDGDIHFTGTAYFPDINKLDIRAGGFSKNMKLNFSRDQSGRITIELQKNPDSKNKGIKVNVPELSEAELAQKVKEVKFQYKRSKPMMLGMLGTLKIDTLLHLPGKIEEISNFKKINNTTAQVKLEGSRMIEAMDKTMADDGRLKQQIRAGKNPLKDGPDDLVFNEMLFGQKAPVRVVLQSGSKPLFDYNAQVTDAQKNYKNMLEELGFGKTSPLTVPTVTDAPVEPGNLKVGGVSLVTGIDEERGIKPLQHQYQNCYKLSLILELPEPNLKIIEGRVKKAVTDSGQDLLPEEEWNRKIDFPKLSKDKKAAVFNIKLSVPDEDAKGLAELSGVLEYLTATGTRQIDLGIMDLKDGAKSSVEGFSIGPIEVKDWDKEHTQMRLKVSLLRGSFKAVKFYHEDGTELEVSPAGKSYSQGRLLWINFKTKGKFPPRGRIVFEVLDGITRHEIPFKLTNISLTGQPL
jgi:hypothetical protein